MLVCDYIKLYNSTVKYEEAPLGGDDSGGAIEGEDSVKNTPSAVQSTARDLSQCVRCGANTEPLKAKDLKAGSYFAPRWILAAVCVDSAACAERVRARDADTAAKWLEQRYTITLAGLAALQFIEQAEQLHLSAAAS